MSGSRGGELDIVARRGRCLVFCEVKSKTGDGFGDPLEMVGAVKASACGGPPTPGWRGTRRRRGSRCAST